MAKPELLWRRSILGAAVADQIELEQLILAAKEFGAGMAYLGELEPKDFTYEVNRLTTRLVNVQLQIEGQDLD